VLDPRRYIGLAPEQTREYVREVRRALRRVDAQTLAPVALRV
jgi:hypothetical protein